MTRVARQVAAVMGTALLLAAVPGCGRREAPPAGADSQTAGAPSAGQATAPAPSAASPAPGAPAATTPTAPPPAAGAPATPGPATPGPAAPGPAAPPQATPAEGASTSEPPAPAPREIVLFFQASDDDVLVPEKRLLDLPDSVADQAKRIVTELAAGPRKEGLLPTVPDGTKVLGAYVDRAGTVFLDLSEEFVSLHPGGSDAEVATVFSIVDSLTWNVKEIKRVRFLVGGEERDTLKSHLDLRRAYLKDMSIVNMDSSGGGR